MTPTLGAAASTDARPAAAAPIARRRLGRVHSMAGVPPISLSTASAPDTASITHCM